LVRSSKSLGLNLNKALWDRKQKPTIALCDKLSQIEESHKEPVNHFVWLGTKGGNEFVTTSNDGRLCWWDTKKMDKPIETLYLMEDSKSIGGTVIEYSSEGVRGFPQKI